MALTIAQTLNLGTSFYSLLDFVGAWTLTDGTYLYNFTPPQAPSQHAITKIDPTGSMSVVGTWDFPDGIPVSPGAALGFDGTSLWGSTIPQCSSTLIPS